jgi:hypothetical protein
VSVKRIPVERLHERLGWGEPCTPAPSSRARPLHAWRADEDDQPLFRYLYRHHRPRRHLEFGTWRGAGTVWCLESCDATVWTINLPGGETGADGKWAYYTDFAREEVPAGAAGRTTRSGRVVCATDSMGFIGTKYLAKDLGHRVCQVYCDSRAWDASNYPPGFFDSALIDGGHTIAVVESDTRKALEVVRPGGLLLWHDYAEDLETRQMCESVRGVTAAIDAMTPWLEGRVRDLFWIEPSWILVGVRR